MATGERFDLVIRDGTGYDGTGTPGVRADIGVRGERIVAFGTIAARGAPELDAQGLAVTPGFIDVHSHDDYAVLLEPEMPFKVLQGVTSDVVGNCGSGVVPFEAGLVRFRRIHPEADPPPWEGFAGYLERVDAVREASRIGEEAGVPVQISHHKASGRRNWGRVRDSLALIEEARARGLDVTADQYPYTAGSTSLAAVLQNGAFRSDSPGGLGEL